MSSPVFKQYPISEEINSTCSFFTSPQKQGDGITGSLKYNHYSGIYINLWKPLEFKEGMTLYAYSDNFNHYTLYNLQRRVPLEDSLSDSEADKFFDAEFIIMSSGYPSVFPQNDSFTSISFELMNLWHWFPNAKPKVSKLKKSIVVSLNSSPPFTIETPSNKLITFSNNPETKIKIKGFEIEKTPKITIRYSDGKTFQELYNSARELRTLLQLLTGSYCAFTEIILQQNKKTYRIYSTDGNSENNLTWENDFLFLDLSTIRRSLKKIISKWESINTEISQVVDILIMEYNNHNLSPEVRFLNIARAIETFHRRRRPTVNDKKLAALVKKTKSDIPEKYKKKFSDALSHIQGPNLREMVRSLFEELKPEIQKELNLDTDWEDKFVQSRNYYTHFGERRIKVQQGKDLLSLSNQIRAMLYALVTIELGVNEKHVASMLWRLILV